jgi:hypothetical protein
MTHTMRAAVGSNKFQATLRAWLPLFVENHVHD